MTSVMQLEHNPRTKQQIKELLMDVLYKPAFLRYSKQLDEIIRENCQITGTDHPSMIYRGNVYITEEGSKTKMPRRIALLSPSLKQRMDDYLNETNYLNSHELPYVVGYINQVLNVSEDLPDYLRLLPDAVHRPIRQLIETCPCSNTHLGEDKVEELKATNSVPIALMKQRLVLNLIQ